MRRSFNDLKNRVWKLTLEGMDINVENWPMGCRFTNEKGSADLSDVMTLGEGYAWLSGYIARGCAVPPTGVLLTPEEIALLNESLPGHAGWSNRPDAIALLAKLGLRSTK